MPPLTTILITLIIILVIEVLFKPRVTISISIEHEDDNLPKK